MSGSPPLGELTAAAARGDHEAVVRLSTFMIGEHPGQDAAHELRARAHLALGQLDEALADSQAAVRLDPDEVRYRELLAEVLSATGAHREAADEYARLAKLDPRQPAWTRGEAVERLAAGESGAAIDAARRGLRLDDRDLASQLVLARGLLRTGQATPALESANRAMALAPRDMDARLVLADARWLAADEPGALAAYAVIAGEATGSRADEAVEKARALYRSRVGLGGRLLAAIRPLFAARLRTGRLRLP